MVGCDPDLLRRVYAQLGLPQPQDDDRLRTDDVEFLHQDGDYFGRVVNVASRMADYARPGEVLVSEAVVDLGASGGSAVEELGVVELKGVREPVRLFRAIPGAQSEEV